jgi:ribosomal protein L11 methylase PrmA
MKKYPAIDVHTDTPDLLLAIVDDFRPTAVEERGGARVRIFFSTADDRDAAQRALPSDVEVTAIDVDDEDWARRSQENLKPVTVGRITIAPGVRSRFSRFPDDDARKRENRDLTPLTRFPDGDAGKRENRDLTPLTIVIIPSMGFGTGHHVTTRLCLAALQTIDLAGAFVLDVGTGSGVLAIAAVRLGARRALGIDYDADAIQSARENLELNPEAGQVTFDTVDLAARALPVADVVTANLTGAVLVRAAAALCGAARPGGTLILSGIQSNERDEVRAAFAPATLVWERDEDGWVGIAVKKP